MSYNTRLKAYKILFEINEKKAYSNISIQRNTKGIEKLDEAFIRELVYGVLENKLYIDWVIKKYSKLKFKKISPKILQILRLGVYQIVFMDKIPDSAACNESVKLAKIVSHKGTFGFVNGVLRNIARNKEKVREPKISNKIKYLSIKYSHPEWMVKKWLNEFGFKFTKELLEKNNTKPHLNIRVNTLKVSKESLMDKLKNEGFDVKETKYALDGIIINNPSRITDLEEFKKGFFTIQDESSMLVAQIMNPKENSLVLDVCSAPGGKATHIAQKMNNNGKVIARDIYEHKVNLINENSKRLGIDIIETEIFNGSKLDENLLEKVDYCLVDAPCSGLGLIRRKPDIKWTKRKDEIEKLVKLQKDILINASKYLKTGGTLIYSTCTIENKENLELINTFIKEKQNYKLESFSNLVNIDESTTKGYLQMYPNIHSTDGFFIAKLKKL
ncbi:MAG: 16S rRNA (cytosine(967)-C(5))-methyltransferase RsmB [Firmicutes bacterium]|nr:16S rRNA (cytosine(967)-C(5))-methyltransferase RsmB [Bacillota bacterium]